MSQKTAAVIVAAGRGSRAGQGVPKQYRPLPGGAGASVLATTLSVFAAHEGIHEIVVVIHKDDLELYNSSISELKLNDKVTYKYGAEERQASVLNGLLALRDTPPERVLIHDAARPFLSPDLITACIRALDKTEAVLPALPVTDTLKKAEDGKITATLPRDGLYRGQTPQGFAFAAILAAHEAAQKAAVTGLTDDAAIAEWAGLEVALVAGEVDNIKLTFEEEFMGSQWTPRTGLGFDVHRFGDEGSADSIMLGGVAIPHQRALIGHSDADVALHAITDALLGALAAGDIGDHFPPSEAANKDRASSDFLRHAVGLAAAQNARITHIDLTLICESPKIAPHREAMRAAIADICGLAAAHVSVKATTSEGLGFTGRGEGLAAQASATVLMPEIV